MLTPIYLDYAATTPVDKRVLKEMLPYFMETYGNPSSLHSYGQKAAEAVKDSEQVILKFLSAYNHRVVFTSGATESLNTCLKSLYFEYGHERNMIITSKTEHKAVLEVCSYLESIGAEIVYLPVHKDGSISLNDLEENLNEKTLAVALMAVNNETGFIHDIDAIGDICKSYSAKFVCDATQAVGKIALDMEKSNIDYLVLSAHKIYGPKGVGALVFKKENRLIPLIHGGGQQDNYRSGTLNVSGIIGLASAVKYLIDSHEAESKRILELKNLFENELLKTNRIEVLSINSKRSPYISNLLFREVDIDMIKLPLQANVSFSSGSACTSKIVKPSNVITSMGYSHKEAENCLRFSFGRYITREEILYVIQSIKNLL